MRRSPLRSPVRGSQNNSFQRRISPRRERRSPARSSRRSPDRRRPDSPKRGYSPGIAGGRPRSRLTRSPIRGGRSPTPPRITDSRDFKSDSKPKESQFSKKSRTHSRSLSPLPRTVASVRGRQSPSPTPLKRPKAYNSRSPSPKRGRSPTRKSLEPPPLPEQFSDLPPLPPAENKPTTETGYDYGFTSKAKSPSPKPKKSKKSGWKTVETRDRSISPLRKSRMHADEEEEKSKKHKSESRDRESINRNFRERHREASTRDRRSKDRSSRDRGSDRPSRDDRSNDRRRSDDRHSDRHSDRNSTKTVQIHDETEYQPRQVIDRQVIDNRQRNDSTSSVDKKVLDWKDQIKKESKPSGPLLKPKPDFSQTLNKQQQQVYANAFYGQLLQTAQQAALIQHNQTIIQQGQKTGAQINYVNPNAKQQPPMITPKMIPITSNPSSSTNFMINPDMKPKKKKAKKPKLQIPVDDDSSDGNSSSTTLSPVRRDRSASPDDRNLTSKPKKTRGAVLTGAPVNLMAQAHQRALNPVENAEESDSSDESDSSEGSLDPTEMVTLIEAYQKMKKKKKKKDKKKKKSKKGEMKAIIKQLSKVKKSKKK